MGVCVTPGTVPMYRELCVLLCLAVAGLPGGQGLDNFLDCPGNDAIFGIYRRCCTSVELPNGCECFDISGSSPFTNSCSTNPCALPTWALCSDSTTPVLLV